MSKAFEDAKDKIAWADKRFGDLDLEIRKFWQLDPYEEIIEAHPDKPGYQVRKIKLVKEMPSDITHVISEIVGKLRSALDGAGYAVALASGKSAPKSTAFPFSGSLASLSNAIGGRCKDIPAPIQSLFCGFQPYRGGDDLLWSLNEICNAEKHAIAAPIGTGAFPQSVRVRGTGFSEIPRPHKWDGAKNEMVLITLGPDTEFDYEFNFSMFIGFGDVGTVQGREVRHTLAQLGTKVQGIIEAIEAESRRIGLVK